MRSGGWEIGIVLVAGALAGCSARPDQQTVAPTHTASAAPSGPSGSTASSDVNDSDMARRVQSWVKAQNADSGPMMIRWGEADLDGDGKKEVLVYVGGPMMCGSGGCTLDVLKAGPDGFTRIGALSVSQLPVGVLNSSSHGMRDLAVTTYGGGAPEQIMRVPFDGKKYASNPTVKPAIPVDTIGTEVIAAGPLEKLD